ncbi:lysostaphin resistance A-like protein [Solibacillus silvestris]|uniref:CPBP family intramembrane glutamic endopeptidase n=1 Tax=Solibacillus silvestris TaxID=76853 RepID=UPI003F7F2C0C
MEYSQLRNFKLRYFVIFAIFIFIASTILFLFVNIPAGEEWLTFVISVCFLGYILQQTKKWNFTYSEQFMNKTMSKARWAKYLSITACFQLITVVLTSILLIILYLVFEEQIRSFIELFQFMTMETVNTPLIVYILFFINICILAPIWEELLFRGILLRRFTLKWSPQKSIVVSSVIFGIIHLNPINIVFAFALGCVLGYAYLKTKNIVVPMLLHSFSNFLAFLQFCYANQTVELDLPTTEAVRRELYISGAIFLAISFVLVFLLVKYYKHFRQLKNPPLKVDEQPEIEALLGE